jgi:hypothetical protein
LAILAHADSNELPIQVDLLSGELSARVYLHDVKSARGRLPCWSYVSEGLWEHGQKELILTLLREQGEKPSDFPRGPLKFFLQVRQLAEAGNHVSAGDYTEFGSAGFLNHRGLVYIPPQPFDDVELTSPSLAAILLTQQELEAVKAFGATRVTARLGRIYEHYPCPPWSDRGRSGLEPTMTLEESVLAQISRSRATGASVCKEGNRIVLSLLPAAGAALHRQLGELPSNAPIALLTELDPTADGCFVWEPGQTAPSAITPPRSQGSRLCGCFLALVPGRAENAGQLLEDGLMMMLNDQSWLAFQRALETREAVSLPAAGEALDFALEWLEESYLNPIEGNVYQAEGGWRVHRPAGRGLQETADPIEVKRIVLLTPEHELAVRVSTETLSDYLEKINQTVQDYLAAQDPGPGQDLLLQCEVQPPGEAEMKLASRPGIAAEVLQEVYDRLQALTAPEVSGGPIAFQVIFAAWGGSGED